MSGWPGSLPNLDAPVVILPDDKKQLLVDLLHGHIITLEGNRETIADIPELAPVIDEAFAKIDAQIVLAHETLSILS